MQSQSPQRVFDSSAFSRADLLGIVATLSALMLLQIASSGIGRDSSRVAVCADNLRQLTIAWHFYAEDQGGELPASVIGDRPNWSGGGWLDLPISGLDDLDPFAGDDPGTRESGISHGVLWPYTGANASIYRSPADRSMGSHPNYRDGIASPRARSYSMNIWMGGPGWASVENPEVERKWKRFEYLNEIGSPSESFVFISERPDSINDGGFVVEMVGTLEDPETQNIVDFPASYHFGGANLSYADGSVEHHRWVDPRTTPPPNVTTEMQLYISSPNNPDLSWLAQRATH